MTTQERLYTPSDLWEISHQLETSAKRYELVEGMLIEMSPAGGEHGDLASELNMQIRMFVKQHRLGKVTAAETGYVLFTDEAGKATVRAPDVGFVAQDRISQRLPKGYIPFPPDLAIEVVSPNDKPDEIESKISDYLRAGVRLIWHFYLDAKTVRVDSPAGGFRVSESEILDGGDVLPGFSVSVQELFESVDP